MLATNKKSQFFGSFDSIINHVNINNNIYIYDLMTQFS